MEKVSESKKNFLETSKKQENLLIDAEKYLSKELLWKLYLDYAIYLEKRNNIDECRKYLKKAIITSPENLR